MTVADLMTRHVRVVRAETPLKHVAALLSEHRIAGLPVVDCDGRVLGVVSEGDVLRILATDMTASTAREAMTSPATTIGPEAPVSDAAGLMLERGINRLPVVVADELVGIVSRSDLVRAFTRGDDDIAREIRAEIVGRTSWLEPGQVSVEASRGAVALAGVVDTLEDAQRLYRLASRVPGVTSVRSTVRWRRDAGLSRAATE